MEEAEALSSKLAIMVAGKFKCFGDAQHIKSKFGKGFTIELKLDFAKISKLGREKYQLDKFFKEVKSRDECSVMLKQL